MSGIARAPIQEVTMILQRFLLISVFSISLSLQAHPAVERAKRLIETDNKNVSYDFNSPDRKDWNFFPTDRTGLELEKMSSQQIKLNDDLLQSLLSKDGYAKAEQIRMLEKTLAGPFSFGLYDPNRYFTAVFGKPSETTPWGVRYEGHHLSLNYTFIGDDVSFTPFFLGANPASSKVGQPLKKEEELARKLIKSLSLSQRRIAIVSDDAFSEILLTPKKKVRPLSPNGIPYSKLNPTQQKLLSALIEVYLGNFPSSVNQNYRKKVLEDVSNWSFAWAGQLEPRKPHYYRIQGSEFVVEYDNTQNGANHIHTVWHDLKDNFGEDLLRKHLAEDHPPKR